MWKWFKNDDHTTQTAVTRSWILRMSRGAVTGSTRDGIKFRSAPVVRDAFRRSDYASYICIYPFPFFPFCFAVLYPHPRLQRGIPSEFLNAFFIAVRRTIVEDFPSHQWKGKGFPSSFCAVEDDGGIMSGGQCLREECSIVTQMYSLLRDS